MESLAFTFSGFPFNATRVPRLVYRFWEAERDTERREYGAPRTSKVASILLVRE
jgi:hypothetical protein